MPSGPGSSYFGVLSGCAAANSRAGYGKISLPQGIPTWAHFPMIPGDLNKPSLLAVPVLGANSAWPLLTCLSILACQKQCQHLLSMEASSKGLVSIGSETSGKDW